ncbi:MAG TPA: efflux RND transporter permease subunit [Kofleriaceae bacterium]|nr:efflux RND transporter permease subunit [Kofleriaceae bacterium]
MNLTDLCLKRPVFAWMLMFGTMLFGLVSLGLFPGTKGIGVSQFPDVNNPTVSVSVSWPGASPEDVETGIVNPIEDVLAQVTGVEEITSQSKQNSARVTATFDIDRDIDLAVQDVQAKIAQVQRQMPTSVQPPTVSKSNPDDTPIITVGVSGPFARQLLADVARYQVEDALTTLDGVGQVTTMGYVDRAVRIWVDADKLIATSTTVTDITNALTKQHVTSSGGQIQNGQKAIDIRVLGEAADLGALRDIVIRKNGDALVRMSDVALVEDGFEDITQVARMNGQPVQAMGVLMQPGSNAVSVANEVRQACADIQKTLPKGMHIDVLFDTTGFIKESVNEIGLELVLAVVLTAIVCWLFLGSLSSTLNVLFAIPMSLLGTIAFLYFKGWTLNTFTLLGLSLAVGLVVDDAVMVMENIFRHGEMGKDRVRAASDGTKEITFAALAATLAVIAIFLPVAFMTGVIGKYFLQFGVTLSFAVAISYIEAITLAPARCAAMLNVSHEKGLVARGGDAVFGFLSRVYARTLNFAVKLPLVVLILGATVMIGAYQCAKQLKQEMVPSQDQSRLAINLTTTVGADLDETDKLTRKAEAILAKHKEIIGVQTTVSIGSARMQITLVDPKQRSMTQQQLQNTLRGELSKIAGLRVNVQDLSQQGFAGSKGSPIEFTIRGSNWPQLIDLSQKIVNQLTQSELAVDVQSDYQLGPNELAVSPDRPNASDLNVNVSDISTTITALVGGSTIGQYSDSKTGRRMNIDLRLLADQRTRPEDLSLLFVRSTTQVLVPLQQVTDAKEQSELQSINHDNRQRAVRITGNVAAGHAQSDALAYVASLQPTLPPGNAIVLSGQSSQFGDAMSSLIFALIIGIAVAYMVLASQFNSFLHPVTVLTILPLSLAGAMVALWVTGKTLNVFSMIGLLLLMGIVKKNSIILVDYANEIRHAENLDAAEAMRRAGPIRLRPILMTAVATLMAAVPSALGLGPGSETRGPMADAIIGGLLLSTLLSLFVVPSFYVLADRIKAWMARSPNFARISLSVIAVLAIAMNVRLAILMHGQSAIYAGLPDDAASGIAKLVIKPLWLWAGPICGFIAVAGIVGRKTKPVAPYGVLVAVLLAIYVATFVLAPPVIVATGG